MRQNGHVQLYQRFARDDEVPLYAILSHTWQDGEEVMYDKMLKGCNKTRHALIRYGFALSRRGAMALSTSALTPAILTKQIRPIQVLVWGSRHNNR
jgi:hypothetical protein